MIADNAARARALDTSTSFIVQAPAGSGKTELLIQRYLKLLGTVDSPDAIVAITFTRKAAGEMRSRVVEALRRARTGVAPDAAHQLVTFEIARSVLEHERTRGWNLLENPAQMRIDTIDALCAGITRRMPWLARFGAMPEISEKAKDLYREAARNTLRQVENGNEALAYLLLHLDNNFGEAERLLVQMLEKRDQWLRLTGVNPDFEAVRSVLERTLEKLIIATLQRLVELFPEDSAAEIIALRGLERFPSARLADLDSWKIVAELLLTGDGKWRKTVNRTHGFPPGTPLKARAERLLDRLRDRADLLDALQRFRELPAPRFSESQWQAMQAAVSVITLAAAELRLVFAEHGRVDFTELAIRASAALGCLESPSDLALALGQRLEHLLVDEFQDTSFTQFNLIEKLTAGWEPGDGRTLFLVGDPMQSIYRFRQADVSLFSKARQDGIGAIRLEPLLLSVNFRSDCEIVEWVNQTFAGILSPEDDVEAGAVAFAPSSAAKEISGDACDSCIAIHGFIGREAEAERVIELVRDSADAKVAILVRARSHLIEIAAALKRSKIRFQAIEIDQLGRRPVIEDLMALTFALLHPADRVSWLAILRAPWSGLTLADLHALAGADHSTTIWDLLHQPILGLSIDGAARIQRVVPVLEAAIAARGRPRLRDWVETVWLRLGGPACVDDETALEDASAYLDLLDSAAEGADLSNFEWFRDQVNDLFAQPDTQADDRLQLMTIHKAKGLEFDVVILPGLGSTARQEDASLLQWLEERGDLLLAPISEAGPNKDPIYMYLTAVDRRKADQESRRLLYVAATRARHRLHLLGALETGKDGGVVSDPPSRSFLKLLWPVMAPAFAGLIASPPVESGRKPRSIRRVSADWKTPAPPPGIEWTAQHDDSIQSPLPSFEWVGSTARHAGTVVHAILLRIAREGLETWDEKGVRSRRNVYRSLLANLGVASDEMAGAVERVESALVRMLRDSRGRWILDKHSESESELPVTGLVAGKLYSAVIDRTFVDQDGVRWIIDYKIGEHQGADLEQFFDAEVDRYREQLERYAKLLMHRDPRPTRLALYFPLLAGWREWAAPLAQTQHARQATLFEL